jgi:isoquinoline 1-oxidoreductase beta subunit
MRQCTYPVYAMPLARRADGRSGKATWTREQDIRHDVYRPAAVANIKAIVNDGQPLAIDGRIAAPPKPTYRWQR